MQSNDTNHNFFTKIFNYSFLLILLLSISSLVIAQNSGKISGTVVDKASGDPLPGANVLLDGTSMGAATTFEGEYIIHRVSPGDYNMIVKYIGPKSICK
ncbi:MAG: carboxypeptidase-like regulatory domain-containing protein [Ignavibacteriales bacterium]|nr:carboxypeptidase-like regulatory domain-containing protein [Ignavibacteriales bacterium]